MGRPTRSSPPRPLPQGAGEGELELGYVSGVFGVRGEVRVFLHHRETGLLDEPRVVVLVRPDGARFEADLTVRAGAGKRILGRLAGVEDRDAAASWQGARIRVPLDSLPALEPGEYYLWQLEGADVFVGDERVGRVVEVHQTGPVEVFEIRGPDGEDYWVPSLSDYVAEVDAAGGRLVLHPGSLLDGE